MRGPDAARLRSDAFVQVPAVAAGAEGHDSLARALADARRNGAPAGALAELDTAVAALEDARVPYLEACLGNRLVTVRRSQHST